VLYAVLGDGEMASKELHNALRDLWERTGDEPFWFLLQGKSDPTATDKSLVAWLDKNEIYYEVLTDDEDALADIYSNSQKTHTAKRLSQKLINLLGTLPDKDEDAGATVLALFVSDEPGDEADRVLSTTLEAVGAASTPEAPIPCLVLNDGLIEIDMSDEAAAAEAEPEPEPEAPKPGRSKKAAPKAPPVEAPVDQEDEEGAAGGSYTREQLEEMTPAQVKEIAAEMGIELPARTRATTYIEHILGNTGEAEVEAEPSEEPEELPTPPAAFNGIDVSYLADEIVSAVIHKLREALASL
jgi:hypothetical protein